LLTRPYQGVSNKHAAEGIVHPVSDKTFAVADGFQNNRSIFGMSVLKGGTIFCGGVVWLCEDKNLIKFRLRPKLRIQYLRMEENAAVFFAICKDLGQLPTGKFYP
jgi:hypothetical protein